MPIFLLFVSAGVLFNGAFFPVSILKKNMETAIDDPLPQSLQKKQFRTSYRILKHLKKHFLVYSSSKNIFNF